MYLLAPFPDIVIIVVVVVVVVVVVGDEMYIKGEGMPYEQSPNRRGGLTIKLELEFPEELTARQRQVRCVWCCYSVVLVMVVVVRGGHTVVLVDEHNRKKTL